MPMTQDDIRQHYEVQWKQNAAAATNDADLSYSNPFHDEAHYPVYERLIDDVGIRVEGGSVLDVGAGSGRWIRFFLDRWRARRMVGVDFTAASIDLLKTWALTESGRASTARSGTDLAFETTDITAPDFDLGERFDLINVQNVLFHIPENDKFQRALQNLARHLGDGGCIVTTEFMPRTTMRTEWMLVRSRYEFEAAARQAGLRIATIRPCLFLAATAMGVDGMGDGTRGKFQHLWAGIQHVLEETQQPEARKYFCDLFQEFNQTMLDFCSERIAPVDLPGTKFVVLRRDRV